MPALPTVRPPAAPGRPRRRDSIRLTRVSAAVALEVLRLYEEGGVLANGQHVAAHFAAGLDALRAHPLVGDSLRTAACWARSSW